MILGVLQVGNLDERRADHVSSPTLSTTSTVNKNPNAINTTAITMQLLRTIKKNIFFLIREKKKPATPLAPENLRGGGGGGSVSHRVNLAIYKNSHNFFFLISLLSFFPWL